MIWHRSHETSKRLDEIPGIGPALATALVASIADPKAFRSGRNFSAWSGLVPKQHSSGGKQKLGSISKQGDCYLRRANPAGCEAAWWLKREDAKRLLAEARVRGDIEGSAKRQGITLTPHDVCMMRADRCLAQLSEILAHAKQSGDLHAFNQAYRRGRLRAQARGERFIPYSAAETKLKRLLVEAIADGTQGRPFRFALARVFEPAKSV
jgi:hypothetical protein